MKNKRNDRPYRLRQGWRLITEDDRCWHVDEVTREGIWLSDESNVWLLGWGDYYQSEAIVLPAPEKVRGTIRVDVALREWLKGFVKDGTTDAPRPEKQIRRRIEKIRRRTDKAARCVK